MLPIEVMDKGKLMMSIIILISDSTLSIYFFSNPIQLRQHLIQENLVDPHFNIVIQLYNGILEYLPDDAEYKIISNSIFRKQLK